IRGGKSFERALAELGRPFGWHDFSQYDLDAPFPELGDLGDRSFKTQAERIKKLAADNGFSLRQVVQHQLDAHRSPFVGSPLTVANEIQRWFEAGAFDGINLTVTVPSEFAVFTDEVLPILRERGVVRTDYEATTLRGNLGLPIPTNTHTLAREAVLV
ncbi:MAG: LLM class flavin-dependent oxidoreductase, partial [Catenulispora sp.]|nr:LLM class flavin-dependent oxidoreductase [Catenulispora sp.]